MNEKVADVYAEALYELGVELKCLDDIHKKLEEYKSVFAESTDLISVLSSPDIDIEDKNALICKIFGEKSIAENFLYILVDRNRMDIFNDIQKQFEKLYNADNGICEIKVITSMPLSDEMREKIIAKFMKKTGQKVKLTEEVSPEILGGIIIEYGNTQIDGSVKNAINQMYLQIVSQ